MTTPITLPSRFASREIRMVGSCDVVELTKPPQGAVAPAGKIWCTTVPTIYNGGMLLRMSGWVETRLLRLPTAKDLPRLERAAELADLHDLTYRTLEADAVRRRLCDRDTGRSTLGRGGPR